MSRPTTLSFVLNSFRRGECLDLREHLRISGVDLPQLSPSQCTIDLGIESQMKVKNCEALLKSHRAAFQRRKTKKTGEAFIPLLLKKESFSTVSLFYFSCSASQLHKTMRSLKPEASGLHIQTMKLPLNLTNRLHSD